MKPGLSSALACGLLISASVRGQEHATTAYGLEFSAPETCPGRAAFVTAIAVRAPGAQEVALQDAHLAVHVEIEDQSPRRPGTVTGTLRLRVAGGAESRRDIPEATCAEVVSSMAVITAMFLEAGAPETLSPPNDGPVVASPPHSEASPGVTAGVDPAPALSVAPLRTPLRSPPRVRSTASARWPVAFQGVMRAGLETGVAPIPAPSFATGLRASLGTHGASVQVLAAWAEGAQTTTDWGTADFRRLGVSFAACPVRWERSRPGRGALVPCAVVDLGQLRGRGETLGQEQSQRMLWLGLGVALRVERRLSRQVALELEIGTRVLARHDRFVFEPDGVALDVPRVVGSLSLGVAVGAP